MITAASLRDFTSKDLAKMAKKKGVSGWHSMRKEQLVRALLKLAQAKKKANGQKSAANKTTKKPTATKNGSAKSTMLSRTKAIQSVSKNGRTNKPAVTNGSVSQSRPKNTRVARQIQKANAIRDKLKDLSGIKGQKKNILKDRLVLMVRDAYWLHASWELTRQSIERAEAAMAENWHTARPTLRLLEVEAGSSSTTAERVARDIEIHGGVNNWYIDIQDPPQRYRVAIGYLDANGRFYSLVRSNLVATPDPDTSDAIDKNWSAVADDYEKIYALSSTSEDDGYGDGNELQELFEERLRRPMGSPLVTRFGKGAERMFQNRRELPFQVEAEMIIFGSTLPNAHVSLGGEPLKLRPDGSFTVRLSMPDRRQVLPVVASSSDGIEQRTIILAVERNTKVMEPKIRDANE